MAVPSNVTFDLPSTRFKGDSAKSLNDLQADLSERRRQLQTCLFTPSQVDTIAIKKRLGIALTPEEFRIEINKSNSYLKRMLFSMLYETVILHEMAKIQFQNLLRLEKLKNEAALHGGKAKGQANLHGRAGGLNAHHQRLLREVEHGHSKISYALWKDTETHSWLDGIKRDDVRQAVAETLRERFKMIEKTLEHFDEVLSDKTLSSKQRVAVEKVVEDYKQHLERSTFENMKKFSPKFRELVENEDTIAAAADHALVNAQLNRNMVFAKINGIVADQAQFSLKEPEVIPQPDLEDGRVVTGREIEKLHKLLDLMPKILEQVFGDDGEPIDNKLLQDLCELQNDLFDFKQNPSADLKDKIDSQVDDLLRQAEEKNEFSTVLEPLRHWERNIHVSADAASRTVIEKPTTVDAKSDHPGVTSWKAAAAESKLNGNGAKPREPVAAVPPLVTQDDAPELPDHIATGDEAISPVDVAEKPIVSAIDSETLTPLRRVLEDASDELEFDEEEIDLLTEISEALDSLEHSNMSLAECRATLTSNFNTLAESHVGNDTVEMLRNHISHLEFIDEDELFPSPTAQFGR